MQPNDLSYRCASSRVPDGTDGTRYIVCYLVAKAISFCCCCYYSFMHRYTTQRASAKISVDLRYISEVSKDVKAASVFPLVVLADKDISHHL
jgi:hypothetical protein